MAMINLMSMDQIIALSASIGACLAAIATFLTVWQIKKQRESAYHPELVVPRLVFEGTGSVKDNKVPVDWTKKDGAAGNHLGFFDVPLCNVGLGAAKEVKATWSFPISELIKTANDNAQRTMTPIYLSFDNKQLHIKSENLINSVVFTERDSLETIDYVLPMSIQTNPTTLRLPASYIYLVSILIFLACKEKDEKRLGALEIPNIKLQLEYHDIANTKHTTTVTMNFNLVAFGGNCEFFNAYFETKKSS